MQSQMVSQQFSVLRVFGWCASSKSVKKWKRIWSRWRKMVYVSKLRTICMPCKYARDDVTFAKASSLFLKKWNKSKDDRVLDLIKYFKTQWLEKYSMWYEGAAPQFPSTNNGLEATNAWIKRGHTLRERLPVGQFLNSATELVHTWSVQRNPGSVNCLHFVLKFQLHPWKRGLSPTNGRLKIKTYYKGRMVLHKIVQHFSSLHQRLKRL